MSQLTDAAFGRIPMKLEKVEEIYADRAMMYPRLAKLIRELCESHERLRLEVKGLEILQAEDAETIRQLREKLHESGS